MIRCDAQGRFRWAVLTVAAVLCAGVRLVGGQPPDPPPAATQPAALDAGLQLIRRGQYAEARRRLEAVVSAHPDWHLGQLYLGLTYHKEDRFERAVEYFDRALALDPNYHPTRMFYGWALYYLGRMPQAREMFEAYLKVDPDYPDAVFAVALIAFDQGNIEVAQSGFERCITLAADRRDDRTEAKSRARLGDVLVRQGRLAEARTQLEQSIRLNPDNYEAYFKLSRVLQRLGDIEGAERAREQHRAVRQRLRPASSAGASHEP